MGKSQPRRSSGIVVPGRLLWKCLSGPWGVDGDDDDHSCKLLRHLCRGDFQSVPTRHCANGRVGSPAAPVKHNKTHRTTAVLTA